MRLVRSIALFVCACSGSIGGSPGDVDAKSGSGNTPDAPGGVGEPANLAGITLAHNNARAKVGVAPLAWDPQLAAIAQAWVQQCIDTDGNGLVDHNANRSQGYSTYVGENIYASTGTATGPDAVADWVSEGQYYDYASNTCAAGQICGHYTQVVWAATQKLGCVLYDCKSLQFSSTIVCDYGPGGNDGGRPY
jgi:pathogenesis-related protein 1